MEISHGYCYCGCGQETSIAKQNYWQRGWIKGQPVKCIRGHRPQNYIGSNHPGWKGGKRLSTYGYVLIWSPDHPRADHQGYVREHILIVEEVFGKPLPEGSEIHHVNENKADNRKENLVICENNAYHKLLHQRIRALKVCGHANYRKCNICKEYDDPENLYINKRYSIVFHKKCKFEYQKQSYARKRAEGSVS